jgi:hypothetical protein
MCLRRTVEKEERGARPAFAHAQGHVAHVDHLQIEPIEAHVSLFLVSVNRPYGAFSAVYNPAAQAAHPSR